jgi:type I restriction enzyme, S subunit
VSKWIESTIGDVFDVVGGGTPSTEKTEYWNGPIPWITSADIDEHSRITPRKAISEKAVKESATSKVPTGSVVVVTRVGLGKVGIAETELCFSQDCQGLLFDQEDLEPKFVAHQLVRATKRFHEVSRGTTISGVTKKQLLSTPFFVAPRGEQKRVVDKLEELLSDLEAGAAALERARANLKRYRAAALKAAVEGRLTEKWRTAHPDTEPAAKLLERILAERRKKWEEAQLRKFAEKGQAPPKGWKDRYSEPPEPDGAALPKLPSGWCWATVEQLSTRVVDGVHKKPTYVPAGVPFITVRNLTAGAGISFEKVRFITLEDHREFSQRAPVEKGDILISKDGTLGVVRLVDTDEAFSIFVSVALVKPVLRSISEYVCWAMKSQVVQAQMVPKGSGLQHIHLEDLRRDCVPMAPLDEQRLVVEELERLNTLISAAAAEIERSQERGSCLRQSILKSAFEGKLVPQDPRDEPASELLKRIRVAREAEAGKRVGVKRREARSA